jgi:hypothetical protein
VGTLALCGSVGGSQYGYQHRYPILAVPQAFSASGAAWRPDVAHLSNCASTRAMPFSHCFILLFFSQGHARVVGAPQLIARVLGGVVGTLLYDQGCRSTFIRRSCR